MKQSNKNSLSKYLMYSLNTLQTYLLLIKNFLCSTNKALIFALMLMTSLHSSLAIAAENDSLEVKLKAAYIYNFLRFVEWPETDKLTTNICVYGIKESYRPAFNSMATLSKKSRKLNIKLLSVNAELNSLKSCQIIFITDKAEYKNKEILDYTKDISALTIGESSNFIQQGGLINFIRIRDKIKFEINAEAAKSVGLKIPSKVLRIAERLVSLNNHE
jgi:uncharacterized protein DUF4154